MSSRNWLVRIQDILDSTRTIRDCAAGLSFETHTTGKNCEDLSPTFKD